MFTRRLLLLAPLLALPRDARGADAQPSATTSLGGLTVPAGRSRLLAHGTMGGVEVSLLAFAADPPEGDLELLGLAGGGTLLALEPLTWNGPGGERLHTRPTLVPDHLHLRLERTASVPRGRGFRHESWTDYLAWADGAPLRDTPVRPAPAGTCQAALATTRAALRALISVGLHAASPALLAACPPPVLGTGD